MKYLITTMFLVIGFHLVEGQTKLGYYIDSAEKNSPVLNEQNNLIAISKLEQQRLFKEIMGPSAHISADILAAPYFNNSKLIDANPDAKAMGYDIGITNGGLYSTLFNINQPLFSKNTYETYGKAMEIEQQKLSFNNELSHLDLEKLVTDQYINVYLDQELISMNAQLLTIIEDQATIIRALVKSAILKQSDAVLIDLEMKNQKAMLAFLKSKRKQDLFDLYTLCGISDSTNTMLEKPVFQLNPSLGVSDFFLQQYIWDSLALTSNQKIFETKYRPTVNLFGNAGLNAVSLTDIQRKAGFSFGLGIILPIYDGNQKHLNYQKTVIAQNSVKRYKYMKNVEVQNNLLKLKEAIGAVQSNIETLQTQEKEFNTLFAQFKVEIKAGQLSIIDYINSLKIYRQVQINLLNLERDLMLMKNAYNYWNQ